MFLIAFVSVEDTCFYEDRYGVQHNYCHTLEVGGLKVPYESLRDELQLYNLFSSSFDIHAYSYYYAAILMRRLGVPREYRLMFLLLSSVGWELFETYGWRTTPISITDLIADALGFAVGEWGGDRLSLVLGFQPMREYPKGWIERGEVNDGSPAYMLMGRFNTNYSPRTLYLRLRVGDARIKLGYNLGASYGKIYMYYHPYTVKGIPSLYVSPDIPPLYVDRVPLPPVATECVRPSLWCFWTANLFLQIEVRH